MKKLIGGAAAILIFMGCAMKSPVAKTESLDWFKTEFLTRVNTIRQKGCNCGKIYMPPAPPVVWNSQLETAAYWHAKDMADRKYFSHTSQDGRVLRDRVTAVGYTITGVKSYSIGENIAQGQRSIKQVTDEWLKSEGHCMNLMNPAFKEMGVAIVGNYYWVQDFGGREQFSEPAHAK